MLLGISFFISSFLIGIVIVNYFLKALPQLAKLPTAFFLGVYTSTMATFFIVLLFQRHENALYFSLISVFVIQIVLCGFIFTKKRSLFIIKVSRFEIILFLLFFLFGWYIMQKTFSYSDGNFLIASNIYLDFGAHIPIIRSFSMGENIPPTFPFAAGIPLLYHFFFDFAVALYEKMGVRIDYSFNFLSACSLVGVLGLLFSLSQEVFGKKRMIGFFAVILFLFNSSLSFISAITLYWGQHFLSRLYHHTTYLGNGPFGESIVSIFWNLNTYVNQRHLLFSLGLFLIVTHYFYYYLVQKKITFPWSFLAFMVGLLPFWHTSVFLALFSMGSIILIIRVLNKNTWNPFFFFLLFILCIALPQIIAIKQLQTVSFSFFTQGFLLSKELTLQSITQYWFHNLGISLLLIPLGVFLAQKKQRLFFIPIIVLFLIPNLFQFSPQMFDNHKFFNMFILLANIYTASLLYLLWKKRLIYKIFACVLLFFLTFSGVIDFFVLKNDIKIQIKDYPSSKFFTWIKRHTDQNAVFITNVDVYEPMTFIGRKSFLGRHHHLWTYGIDPEERLKVKKILLSSEDTVTSTKLLKTYNIKYVILYKQKNLPGGKLKKIYQDNEYLVLQVM